MIAYSKNGAGRNGLKAKPAKRHVTIREVAKAAGASVSTVSAALNNSDYVSADMRQRIEAVGGRCLVVSAAGRGTTVTFELRGVVGGPARKAGL